MYHSVTFNDEKNTWKDWCLIPQDQIVITPPTQKTNYIDIPGASGSLDMSTALTGYPLFNDRTGSMTFLVMNRYQTNLPECNPKKIHKLTEDIMEYLHGRECTMILDDDPLYYYKGRFTLTDINPDPNWSTIAISYTLEPYKWSIYNSVDTNWLWDPFSFDDDVVYKGLYSDLEASTMVNTLNIPGRLLGSAPIRPMFYMAKNNSSNYWYIELACNNKGYYSGNITSAANYTFDDFVSVGKDLTVRYYCSGNGGKLSINFRPGRL